MVVYLTLKMLGSVIGFVLLFVWTCFAQCDSCAQFVVFMFSIFVVVVVGVGI